jgi:hypothetical protein
MPFTSNSYASTPSFSSFQYILSFSFIPVCFPHSFYFIWRPSILSFQDFLVFYLFPTCLPSSPSVHRFLHAIIPFLPGFPIVFSSYLPASSLVLSTRLLIFLIFFHACGPPPFLLFYPFPTCLPSFQSIYLIVFYWLLYMPSASLTWPIWCLYNPPPPLPILSKAVRAYMLPPPPLTSTFNTGFQVTDRDSSATACFSFSMFAVKFVRPPRNWRSGERERSEQ